MMKLMLFNPWCGALERQSLYVTLEEATGWDLTIITAKTWIDDYGRLVRARRHPTLRGGYIPIRTANTKNIPLHVQLQSVLGLVRRYSPDLVYIYHEPYGIATSQAMIQARLVSDVPVAFRTAQNIAKHYPFPIHQLEQQVYRSSAFAVSVSRRVTDVLRQKGYRKPTFEVPMGVTVSGEDAITRPRNERLKVGYVGRLVFEKGVHLAVQAVASVSDIARLEIIGSGPMEADLRRLCQGLGVSDVVSFTGPAGREHVWKMLARLDVLLVPSLTTPRWKEQFGRVVVEAATVGTPAIVSDSGELPFLVGDLGGGWVVPENDVVALAKTLSAIEHDRDTLEAASAQVRLVASRDYSEPAVAAKLAAALAAGLRGTT